MKTAYIALLIMLIPLAVSQNTSCVDTDDGLIYDTRGNAQVTFSYGKITNHRDRCYNDDEHVLEEYYCEGDDASSRLYNCPNGCSSGACLEEPRTYEVQLEVVADQVIEASVHNTLSQPITYNDRCNVQLERYMEGQGYVDVYLWNRCTETCGDLNILSLSAENETVIGEWNRTVYKKDCTQLADTKGSYRATFDYFTPYGIKKSSVTTFVLDERTSEDVPDDAGISVEEDRILDQAQTRDNASSISVPEPPEPSVRESLLSRLFAWLGRIF